MPEREMWEDFFDPVKALTTLGVNSQTDDVAEFGCGYGTFTIPTAKVIKGKIYALDIEPDMILINEAKRILRAEGKLGIIHWNYDPTTPRGPSMDIRPKPEDCIKWAESAGFGGAIRCDLKPYHYGIVLTKGEAAR